MSKKQRIVFYLTEIEYMNIKKKAEECNMSINAYAKQKVLDDANHVKLRRGAASTMAKLYCWSEQTTDMAARDYLKQGGEMLCQSLR